MKLKAESLLRNSFNELIRNSPHKKIIWTSDWEKLREISGSHSIFIDSFKFFIDLTDTFASYGVLGSIYIYVKTREKKPCCFIYSIFVCFVEFENTLNFFFVKLLVWKHIYIEQIKYELYMVRSFISLLPKPL